MSGAIAYKSFTIASSAKLSGIIDLGSPDAVVVAVSIHGTWTAAKVGFVAYVPFSDTTTGYNEPRQNASGSWIGGPYDSTASFDAVLDDAGTAVGWGDGSATSAQYIAPSPTKLWSGARFVKVNAANTQNQIVNGYLVVRL